MEPEKVEAVMSWERLKSVFKIHSFLGLAGYYRRFIEDFFRLAAPMMRLTRKEVKFEWNDDRTRPGYPSRVPRVVPPSEVPLYNP